MERIRYEIRQVSPPVDGDQDGADPADKALAWTCTKCAAEFGNASRPEAPLLPRTVEEWRELILRMLPKPVYTHENGELWGGAGPDLVVAVDNNGIHVMRATITWDGEAPVIQGKPFQTLELSTPSTRVAQAITRAWALQVRFHKWCARCGRWAPKTRMQGDAICHGCATRYLRIIY